MDFDKLVNFKDILDVFDLACCPFCGGALIIGEIPITIARCEDVPFLAHVHCLMESRDANNI